jgi:hypothetical protein
MSDIGPMPNEFKKWYLSEFENVSGIAIAWEDDTLGNPGNTWRAATQPRTHAVSASKPMSMLRLLGYAVSNSPADMQAYYQHALKNGEEIVIETITPVLIPYRYAATLSNIKSRREDLQAQLDALEDQENALEMAAIMLD